MGERRGEKGHSRETRKLKKMAKLFHQRDGRESDQRTKTIHRRSSVM